MRASAKPVLALTMGEPAGIGPEVLVASLRDRRARGRCLPLVIGSRRILARHGWTPGLSAILDPGIACDCRPGIPSASGARASFAAVRLAADLALRGLVDGVVTAPISKEAWQGAGVPYLDHTEFLKDASGSRSVAMMLVAGRLRAVLATRHVPLASVSSRLKASDIVECARLARSELRDKLRLGKPSLALCALNPHGGEAGMLGTEESSILAPAARILRRSGVDVEGPLPADSVWASHRAGLWDAVIALYHDQAMIPLKTVDRYGIVNWTLGIPFVRTSPGHGTALDIAGKGRANPEAMIQALLLALDMADVGLKA